MSFSRQVGRFADNAERKLSLTFKDSAKDVADLANTNYNKGGRLPFDTGFLHASQTAKIGGMPSGQSENEGNKQYAEGDHVGEPPVTVIARWMPGQTLYVAWVASYARYMEARFGFMRGAAEKWEQIVKANAKKRR